MKNQTIFLIIGLLAFCSSATFAAKKPYTKTARVTAYDDGDNWSKNRITSTQIMMRTAIPAGHKNERIGVCAINPKIVPYGSLVIIKCNHGTYYYLAADTGKDVKNRKAAKNFLNSQVRRGKIKYGSKTYHEYNKAIVVDVHTIGKHEIGDHWEKVTIIPYPGKTSFLNLSESSQNKYLNWDTWNIPKPTQTVAKVKLGFFKSSEDKKASSKQVAKAEQVKNSKPKRRGLFSRKTGRS